MVQDHVGVLETGFYYIRLFINVRLIDELCQLELHYTSTLRVFQCAGDGHIKNIYLCLDFECLFGRLVQNQIQKNYFK